MKNLTTPPTGNPVIPNNGGTPVNSSTPVVPGAPMSPGKTSINIADIRDGAIACLLSAAIYLIVRFVVLPDITWWLKELCSLIVTLGIFAGFAATNEKHSKFGDSVVIFVLVIFSLFMIWDYSKDEHQKTEMTEMEIMVLEPGLHSFELKPGESTNWMQFPVGRKYDYSINSESFEYEIVYTDGDSYQGNPDLIIPVRKFPILKIISTSKEVQIVRINVI